MRELFERLAVEGEAGVDRLIEDRTQEGVQLDFKLKTDPGNGRFADADRKVLGKVLSAFSNSAGGLAVWGVNAEMVDGVDCAQPPAQPIAEIERFQTEASSLVGQLLQPKHDGIEIRAVPSTREPGSGYLLIYVPRSERRPHRSEAKDQKQYFKRSGDSSFPMEHYDIEDAFRRVSVPELTFVWSLAQHQQIGDGTTNHRIALVLQNPSHTSARFAYLHVRVEIGGYLANGVGLAQHWTEQDGWLCRQEVERVINPGNKMAMGLIESGISRPEGRFFAVHQDQRNGPFLVLQYRLGCENARMRQGKLTLTVEDLDERFAAMRTEGGL